MQEDDVEVPDADADSDVDSDKVDPPGDGTISKPQDSGKPKKLSSFRHPEVDLRNFEVLNEDPYTPSWKKSKKARQHRNRLEAHILDVFHKLMHKHGLNGSSKGHVYHEALEDDFEDLTAFDPDEELDQHEASKEIASVPEKPPKNSFFDKQERVRRRQPAQTPKMQVSGESEKARVALVLSRAGSAQEAQTMLNLRTLGDLLKKCNEVGERPALVKLLGRKDS